MMLLSKSMSVSVCVWLCVRALLQGLMLLDWNSIMLYIQYLTRICPGTSAPTHAIMSVSLTEAGRPPALEIKSVYSRR